jgi:2,3-dihydroxyphenylpropionate 1,2-dioxygenase
VFQSSDGRLTASDLARLATGNLKSLIGYDEDELDRAGNIELRWWGGLPALTELRYPSIKPELVGLIDALHGIAHDAERRAEYLADRAACAERFRLTPDQRAALVALDHKAIVAMGTRPIRSCRSSPACKWSGPDDDA